MKKCLLALFLVLGLCVFASTAMADVVGDFDDANGNGTDTYPGVAGDGWGGAWTRKSSGASTWAGLKTLGDVGYTPFDSDNDNFMAFKVTNNGVGKGAVYRNYKGTSSDVDYDEDYTIAFSFRAEDLTTFVASGNYFQFYGDPAETYNISTDSTFQIRVVGLASSDPTYSSQWYFSNGDKSGGNIDSFWSGVYLVEGHIYDFLVTMHPDDQSWDVSVTDRDFDANAVPSTAIANPLGSATATDLGWRGASDGKYLSFAAREAAGTGELLRGNIDNICISNVAVPEPSTFVLLISALFGLLIWRRK